MVTTPFVSYFSEPRMGFMKGLIWRLIFIFSIMIGAIGLFLIANRPLGVAVDCEGSIEGFGSPSYPLSSYESQCDAAVSVSQNNQTVCIGEGSVKGSESVISCPGLDEVEKTEELQIEANFTDDSDMYAKDSGTFGFN